MLHLLSVYSIPYESFTKQPEPACLCSGSPFPTLVSVMEQESSGWMLCFFKLKQVFHSYVRLASEAAVRFLIFHAIHFSVYLIDDRKVTRAATPCWGFLPGECVSSTTRGASAASLPKVIVRVFVRCGYA